VTKSLSSLPHKTWFIPPSTSAGFSAWNERLDLLGGLEFIGNGNQSFFIFKEPMRNSVNQAANKYEKF
jgi:hypothetical protein